jgi:hypothetical protein
MQAGPNLLMFSQPWSFLVYRKNKDEPFINTSENVVKNIDIEISFSDSRPTERNSHKRRLFVYTLTKILIIMEYL